MPRYMLNNLIDGLEQAYDPDGPSRTGLARISAAVLGAVPGTVRPGDGGVSRPANSTARRHGWSTITPTGCKATPILRTAISNCSA